VPPPGRAQRKPGYGLRHPDLVMLLAPPLRPAVTERIVWPGNIVVDVAAYPVPTPLPPDLVTSVRCIVRVGQCIVVCQSPDMLHVWPGGRRLPGETYEMTARREVHEETGWLIDEADLTLLGFLHFRYVAPQPDDHPYPHPDFLQVVYTGRANSRDGRATDWIDLDGWEQGHRLLALSELGSIELSAVQRAFVNVLANASDEPGLARGR
jgi:ADP-ribose pyrophosphatase YjhB (NUDIX family)